MLAAVMGYEQWRAGGLRMKPAGSAHTLFVRQDGPVDGAPITLLHGFPTSSHDWAPVLPYLVGMQFRVTTFDFLGFGASDKPRRHRYSLLEQTDLVEALWASLGIVRTDLVAHDYGVSVAQELLARDPSRIASVQWLNGGLLPRLHRPTREQRVLRSRFGPVAARLFSERRFRPAMRGVLGRDVSDAELHEMWISLAQHGGARLAPALLSYLDDRRDNADRWESALRDYPGSQRFIWGPVDPVSGAHMIAGVRAIVPAAEYLILDTPPPVGHYPQVEAPEIVGPILAAPPS